MVNRTISSIALFDFPLDRLREYQPAEAKTADFDAFWKTTLDACEERSLDAVFVHISDSIVHLSPLISQLARSAPWGQRHSNTNARK